MKITCTEMKNFQQVLNLTYLAGMPVDQRILNDLAGRDEINTLIYAQDEGLDHQEVVGSIKGLLALPGGYIKVCFFVRLHNDTLSETHDKSSVASKLPYD